MCAVNLIPALYKKFIAKSNLLRDMFNLKKIYHKIMNYLTVKKPQLGRFYLLPKIHNWKINVPGRPVISNNGTAAERISSFF